MQIIKDSGYWIAIDCVITTNIVSRKNVLDYNARQNVRVHAQAVKLFLVGYLNVKT